MSRARDVAAIAERVRAAWPGLVVNERALAPLIDAEDGARVEDLYLASACAAGDASALDVLDRVLTAKLPRWIARVQPTEALVAETRQRLWISLVVAEAPRKPGLANYRGRGPLEAWLRVAALRTALAVAGETRRDVPVPDELEASALDPELALLKRKYGRALNAAFADALERLSVEQRNVLRLHYLDGLTLEQVASATRVSRATAARRLADARNAVASATLEKLKERLDIDTREAESLFAFVQSQIDPVLGTLIAKPSD